MGSAREVWLQDLRSPPRPQPNLSILDESVPSPSSRSPYTQTETLLEVTLKVIKYTPLLVEEGPEDLAEGV